MNWLDMITCVICAITLLKLRYVEDRVNELHEKIGFVPKPRIPVNLVPDLYGDKKDQSEMAPIPKAQRQSWRKIKDKLESRTTAEQQREARVRSHNAR